MISIRELRQEDDLEQVLALCREFFIEYEGHHAEFFDTDNLSDDMIRGRFEDSLTSDDSATIIALDDDRIVGYASVAVRTQPDLYKIKRIGSASVLMVDKGYRRRGIATKLVKESKQYFKRREVKYFTFFTSVSNHDALEFYRQLGVHPIQTVFLGESTDRT